MFVAMMMALVFASLSSWSAPGAKACSCPSPPDPEEALGNAEMVFAGEVVDISNRDERGNREIDYRVSEVWKGVDQQAIMIGTLQEGGGCGYSFEAGNEYLLYVVENQSRTGLDLVMGICQQTAEMTESGEDLQILGTGTQGDDLEPGEQADGLNLWLLFGSIGLFLAIVVAITLLRRLK